MLSFLLFACNSEEPEWSKVPDVAPLRRMTSLQYKNTLYELYGFIESDEYPIHFPEAFSLDGFNNNAQVNTAQPALVEAYQNASISITEYLMEEDYFAVCTETTEPETCIQSWLETETEQLWRRPIQSTERQDLNEFYAELTAEIDKELALQLILQYLLQTPEFIYFGEFGDTTKQTELGIPLTSWELATRMSYFLWNGPPDAELRARAKADDLQDRSEIITQAWRMLEDPRARKTIEDFHVQWLELDKIGSTSLDFEIYNIDTFGFDSSDYLHQILQPHMAMESRVLIDQIIFSRSGQLAEIFNTSIQYTTEPLSVLYGVEIREDAPQVRWEYGDGDTERFYEVQLLEEERAGVLTQLGILNAHATPKYPSPIKRGVFVKERILCQPLGSPPSDIPPLESSAVEPETNRDRYAMHSENPACAGCHKSIDGIGFTFENYDTLGQYRTTDNGHPVNAQGELFGTDVDGVVTDAVDLSQKLSQSQTVHDCYADQMFRYAYGRSTNQEDTPTLKYLKQGFWASNGDIAELIVNIVTSHEFRNKKETL